MDITMTKIDDNTVSISIPPPSIIRTVTITSLIVQQKSLQSQLDNINAQLQQAADLGVASAVTAVASAVTAVASAVTAVATPAQPVPPVGG